MSALPQRVLFITSSFPDSREGVRAVFIKHLALELSARGIEVDVLTPRIFDDSPLREEYPGVTVHRFPFRSEQKLLVEYSSPPLIPMLSYVLSGMKMAARLHHVRNYDIIHGHWVIPTGTMAAWMARRVRRPLVISSHGSDLLVWARKRLLGTVARWSLQQADCCTANSQPLLEMTRALGGRASSASLVYETGVDTETFFPTDDRSDAKRTIGVDPETPIILFVGHLIHRKGVDVALAALRLVIERGRQACLVLAGDGSARADLECQVANSGLAANVVFLGGLSNEQLPPYYRACDLFLLPSRSEGMGVVLLEAAASGKPVVASRVDGIPSVVEDGTTGLLVPPENPEAIAAALQRLLDDTGLRERMGIAARRRAETEFSREEQLRRILQIYREAMYGR